jgi:alpha-glucosidase
MGSYAPWWKTVEVVIFDWPSAKADARVTGGSESLRTSYDSATRSLHITVPDAAGKQELRVTQ